ncbi:GNAT family N-acetyltransferase [Winogradskyella jejuensis]|uniref:Ribosomal protein S18 acetylase RimI n=1 Tax=Winogradskyella jejuensis TaxID=1089305 RepID=A0A1M5TZ40_9FLAO|nr:GNAT family N-acetyltransferase [Winogradskyella jejuensis]SHH56009.1 Ribosomal protein S18 acetylase RimI [Winogradskyella jejuensis]
MIDIRPATIADAEVLALLGRVTYSESHGHFIDNNDDLMAYMETAFSVSKTKQDITDPKNRFYISYADDLPVGYAKLVLNSGYEDMHSENSCQLERIYILKDFIPLKIGQQFLTFLEAEAKALEFNTIWLSVYNKNERAIRFYQKNDFKDVGLSIFIVNGKAYENMVFSKDL